MKAQPAGFFWCRCWNVCAIDDLSKGKGMGRIRCVEAAEHQIVGPPKNAHSFFLGPFCAPQHRVSSQPPFVADGSTKMYVFTDLQLSIVRSKKSSFTCVCTSPEVLAIVRLTLLKMTR